MKKVVRRLWGSGYNFDQLEVPERRQSRERRAGIGGSHTPFHSGAVFLTFRPT